MWEIYIFNLLLNISHKIFSFTHNVLERKKFQRIIIEM